MANFTFADRKEIENLILLGDGNPQQQRATAFNNVITGNSGKTLTAEKATTRSPAATATTPCSVARATTS